MTRVRELGGPPVPRGDTPLRRRAGQEEEVLGGDWIGLRRSFMSFQSLLLSNPWIPCYISTVTREHRRCLSGSVVGGQRPNHPLQSHRFLLTVTKNQRKHRPMPRDHQPQPDDDLQVIKKQLQELQVLVMEHDQLIRKMRISIRESRDPRHGRLVPDRGDADE